MALWVGLWDTIACILPRGLGGRGVRGDEPSGNEDERAEVNEEKEERMYLNERDDSSVIHQSVNHISIL